jgi:RimJ/RimL family protein N-acetyltransferase
MTDQTALPPTPVLETARLILRPLSERDTPAIQRRFPRWDIVRHLHAGIPWPYPDDGAETNVRECLEQRQRGERFFWTVTLKGGDDELIGRIDLWPPNVNRDMRGFWLDPEFQGHGLMTEAAERVTQYAFEDQMWPLLYLTNAEANRASHRIKEKQGALIIDRSRDAYMDGPGVRVMWLLTRDAWLARRG